MSHMEVYSMAWPWINRFPESAQHLCWLAYCILSPLIALIIGQSTTPNPSWLDRWCYLCIDPSYATPKNTKRRANIDFPVNENGELIYWLATAIWGRLGVALAPHLARSYFFVSILYTTIWWRFEYLLPVASVGKSPIIWHALLLFILVWYTELCLLIIWWRGINLQQSVPLLVPWVYFGNLFLLFENP